MQEFVDAGKVPNLTTLVARKGQIVHFESRGYLDVENKVPIDKTAIYRLYSNSKPIAGLATLILYERGLIDLDDPISVYLPEWTNILVWNSDEPLFPRKAKRCITIRDLLANTTGLMSPDTIPSDYQSQYLDILVSLGWIPTKVGSSTTVQTSRDKVREFSKLPLRTHPGDSFNYHVGYPILGSIIEIVAGKPLSEFLQETIFGPLEMLETGISINSDECARMPNLYVGQSIVGEQSIKVWEQRQDLQKFTDSRPDFDIGGGGGGLLSTASDYAKFAQMLLNGGSLNGARVLGRKTLELLSANHAQKVSNPLIGPGFHWGLGVVTFHGNGCNPMIRSIGSYGCAGAAGTNFFLDPTEELFGLVFTQLLRHDQVPDNNYRAVFERITYQSLV